jgi:hypothetical protein
MNSKFCARVKRAINFAARLKRRQYAQLEHEASAD